MKNKFLIKIVFLAVIIAAMCHSAVGQVKYKFVGDNQVVLRDAKYKTVTLGDPANSADDPTYVHYHWDVIDRPDNSSCLLEDEKSGNPKLTVSADGTYILECIRVSLYGYQSEAVAVDVRSDFDIVSVENKYSCYSVGETVSVTDFNIITDPPGFEHLVKLKPGYEKAQLGLQSVSHIGDEFICEEVVKFYFEMTDGTQHVPERNEGKIKVVNSNDALDIGSTAPGANIDKIWDWLENLSKKIGQKIGNKDGSPFITISKTLTFQKSADCCSHEKEDAYIASGSVVLAGGVAFPIPTPCSHIVCWVKPSAEASLTLVTVPITGCRDIGGPVIKGKVGCSISGELTLIPGTSTFNFEVGAKGYGSIEVPLADPGSTTLRLGLSAFVTLTAVITLYSGEWVLLEGQWTFANY